jgi:hypothetical protein
MGINTREVVKRLIGLSDNISMLKSEMESTTLFEAKAEKLNSDLQLVKSLRPIPHSLFESWQQEIIHCVQDYMEVVFLPVTNVGHFGLPPANTYADTNRRNTVRTRLNQISTTRRDALPEDVYIQAQDMLNRKHVAFLDSQQGSSSRAVSPSKNRERGRSRPCHARTGPDTVRRNLAPISSFEMEIEILTIQCGEMREAIRRIRHQTRPRDDSLEPMAEPVIAQHGTPLRQNTNNNNSGDSRSRSGQEGNLANQSDVHNRSRLRTRILRSTEFMLYL